MAESKNGEDSLGRSFCRYSHCGEEGREVEPDLVQHGNGKQKLVSKPQLFPHRPWLPIPNQPEYEHGGQGIHGKTKMEEARRKACPSFPEESLEIFRDQLKDPNLGGFHSSRVDSEGYPRLNQGQEERSLSVLGRHLSTIQIFNMVLEVKREEVCLGERLPGMLKWTRTSSKAPIEPKHRWMGLLRAHVWLPLRTKKCCESLIVVNVKYFFNQIFQLVAYLDSFRKFVITYFNIC